MTPWLSLGKTDLALRYMSYRRGLPGHKGYTFLNGKALMQTG